MRKREGEDRMPLNCGVGGQSATAQRYIAAANGQKMPSRREGSKSHSNLVAGLVLVGPLDEINESRQAPLAGQAMNSGKELL